MTDLEKRAIAALYQVSANPYSWHPRRIAALNLRATVTPAARLKCTEAADLWFLVWHYRRQIADAAVIAEADRLRNGALRLIFDLEPSLAKG